MPVMMLAASTRKMKSVIAAIIFECFSFLSGGIGSLARGRANQSCRREFSFFGG
jgi:hypothetical protein